MANFIEILFILYSVLLFMSVLNCVIHRKPKDDFYFMFLSGGVACIFNILLLSFWTSQFFYLILDVSLLICIISINRYIKRKANKKQPISFKTWLKKYGGGWPKGTFGSDIMNEKFEEYEVYLNQIRSKEVK
ncbi:MAG: hypothetical protein ACFFCI_01080 [Promethearchaeota archaeon]